MRAREAELGRRVYGRERADLYGTAPIAVTAEVGRLLYVLTAGCRARRVVEFGASLGYSTIHLAAALRDRGGGTLISTELDAEKARLAAENLEEAALADLVELRAGDARVTLADLEGAVDLLFLDGWNDLYLAILALMEPRLGEGSLVVADLSADDPACVAYREHVEDPAHGYVSVTLPLDAGVVVSARLPGV